MSKVKVSDLSSQAKMVLCEILGQKKNWVDLIGWKAGEALDISIQINGVEFDFSRFVNEYLDRMEQLQDKRAAEIIDEKLYDIFNQLGDLEDEFKLIRRKIRQVISDKLKVEFDEDVI